MILEMPDGYGMMAADMKPFWRVGRSRYIYFWGV
jgi:hypothetical protein